MPPFDTPPFIRKRVARLSNTSAAIAAHEAASDPHPQYLTSAEADLLYSPLGHTHDDRYYTETEVDTLIADFITAAEADALFLTPAEGNAAYSPLGHSHNDLYYTETEVDALLAAKSDAGHTHAHGALTGLSDDDHAQYHTNARALAWLGTRSTSDLSEGTNLYYTTERAQDDVGSILVDSAEIDLTYNDVTPSITASIKLSSIDETKLDTSVNASLDLADSAAQPGDNVSIFVNDAGYLTSVNSETVQDIVGAMVSGNTETGITVTYDDASGKLNFVLDYTGAWTGTFDGLEGTAYLARANHTGTQPASTISDFTESVQDTVGAMVTGNTETGITVTYDDADGTLDFVLVTSGNWSGTFDGLEGTAYLARANHTGTQVASTISDLSEAIDDRVAALIQNGTGITWSYNDTSGTLTPTVSLSAFSTTNLTEGTNLYFTNERAQDAIGSSLVSSSRITLTYNDIGNTITADLVADTVSNTYLSNMAQGTIKGRASGAGTGDPTDLTAAQVRTIINVEDGATSDQSAAEILAALLTVDGSGSGLDADLWDGNQFASFINQALLTTSSVTHANLTVTSAITAGTSFRLGTAGTGRITAGISAGTRQYWAGRNADDTDFNWAAEFGWDGTNQRWYFDQVPYVGSNAVWHAGNDGASSGLDADLLDGQHGAYYLARGNHTGTQTAATISDFTAAVEAVVGSSDDDQRLIKTEVVTGATIVVPDAKQYLVHDRLRIEGTGRVEVESGGRLVVIGRWEQAVDESGVPVHTHDDRYYTEAEVASFLSGKSDTSHDHDGAYSVLGHNHDSSYGKWVTVTKTTDQAKISDTTLAADNELQFPVSANTKYRFRAKIFYDAHLSPDFKWRHAGPAASLVRIHRRTRPPGAGYTDAVDTAFSGSDIILASSVTDGGMIEFDGIAHISGSSGTFSFQWAQNLSDLNPATVRAGSYIEYMTV